MPRKRKPSLPTAFGIILVLIVLLDIVDAEKEPYESHLDKRPYALTCYSGIGPVASMKPKECVPMNHFNKKPWCYLDWQYDSAKKEVYMAGGCTYGLQRRSCQQVLFDTVRCTCIGDLCNADLKCPDKFCKVCKVVNAVLIKPQETEAPPEATTTLPPLPLASTNLPLLTFKPKPITIPPTLLPKPPPKLLTSNPKPQTDPPQPLPPPELQIAAIAETAEEPNSGTSQGPLLLLGFCPLITTFYIHARLHLHHPV
uniref:Thyroglobulin type-1 domain-containing protein n=1 Tax=Panagrellus redivivus TaxID=6233 RepID=A0A7E4VUI0_PANRE